MLTFRGATFQGPDYGFFIPKTWEIRRRFMGTDIMALMPLEGQGDTFQENINIVLDNVTVTNIDAYYEIQLDSLQHDLQQFNLLVHTETVIDGLPAKYVEFTHDASLQVYTMQWYIIYGGGGYVITCTTVPGREAEFRPKFKELAETFIIDQ